MGKTLNVETIVLATHNVGEADRFCILFTKEKGRLMARARGVRKPKSRMGGCILPMQHINLQLRESSAGWQIGDAGQISQWNDRDVEVFLPMQQGTEMLLSVLHDEEPLPNLFSTVLRFFKACSDKQKYAVLAFTIELLEIMGLLPGINDAYFRICSENQRDFLRASFNGDWRGLPTLSVEEKNQFSALLAPLLSQISSSPLKSGGVIYDMLAESAA